MPVFRRDGGFLSQGPSSPFLGQPAGIRVTWGEAEQKKGGDGPAVSWALRFETEEGDFPETGWFQGQEWILRRCGENFFQVSVLEFQQISEVGVQSSVNRVIKAGRQGGKQSKEISFKLIILSNQTKLRVLNLENRKYCVTLTHRVHPLFGRLLFVPQFVFNVFLSLVGFLSGNMLGAKDTEVNNAFQANTNYT